MCPRSTPEEQHMQSVLETVTADSVRATVSDSASMFIHTCGTGTYLILSSTTVFAAVG